MYGFIMMFVISSNGACPRSTDSQFRQDDLVVANWRGMLWNAPRTIVGSDARILSIPVCGSVWQEGILIGMEPGGMPVIYYGWVDELVNATTLVGMVARLFVTCDSTPINNRTSDWRCDSAEGCSLDVLESSLIGRTFHNIYGELVKWYGANTDVWFEFCVGLDND